jgi:hypothetical protein
VRLSVPSIRDTTDGPRTRSFTAAARCISATSIPWGVWHIFGLARLKYGLVLLLFGSTYQIDGLSPTGKGCHVGTALLVDEAFIGSADVQWLNEKADAINAVIGSEIACAVEDLQAAGVLVKVTFIAVDNGAKSVFNTHRICDPGKRYFRALEFSGKSPLQWSFHPNDAGQSAYADAITAKL